MFCIRARAGNPHSVWVARRQRNELIVGFSPCSLQRPNGWDSTNPNPPPLAQHKTRLPRLQATGYKLRATPSHPPSAKFPEDHRCPLPHSERLYCDYIQRVGLPGNKAGRGAKVRAAKCWKSRLSSGPSQKLGTTCPRLLQFIRDSIPTQHCSGTTKLGGARLTRMKE